MNGHQVVGDGTDAEGNVTLAWGDLTGLWRETDRSPSPHSSEEGSVMGLERRGTGRMDLN